MGYRLGELKHRVTLESFTNVKDGAGGATRTWSTFDTVWGLVRPLRGSERQAAQRREAQADYLIVIRNRDDVLERHRLGWRGRKFNIVFVRARGPREQFLEIEATMGGTS